MDDSPPARLSRNARELALAAAIAALGALLVCGWISLQSYDSSEPLSVSLARYLIQNKIPRPLSSRKLVILFAALPGAATFGVVLSVQLRRWLTKTSPEATS